MQVYCHDLWDLGLPATPVADGFMRPLLRLEVLLLLVPRGLAVGVLTVIDSVGLRPVLVCRHREWLKNC